MRPRTSGPSTQACGGLYGWSASRTYLLGQAQGIVVPLTQQAIEDCLMEVALGIEQNRRPTYRPVFLAGSAPNL